MNVFSQKKLEKNEDFHKCFCSDFYKLLVDAYQNHIKGWQQVVLALLCSFFCGMFFGEYFLLSRVYAELFGELYLILTNNERK